MLVALWQDVFNFCDFFPIGNFFGNLLHNFEMK